MLQEWLSGEKMRQQALRGSCQMVAVAGTAVIGVVLTGYFALLFLTAAAYSYSEEHLWWQPGLLVTITALELVALCRALVMASTSRDVVRLLAVILTELTLNIFCTPLLVGAPLF